ncbi:MAG: hypothetical protein SNJ70_00140 [Armatimonadota bacterium]
MKNTIVIFVFLFLICAVSLYGAPKGIVKSPAKLSVYPEKNTIPLYDTLFGTNSHPYERKQVADPQILERIKTLGFKSFRFPNGCVADLYNWKQPNENQMTVDEWMIFCDEMNAEAYYTINMQGGTEGLDGPIPDGAELNEIIKYKHYAPNPCGYTNYHFGTLAETLELMQKFTIDRALEGKRPILHYEMGNENWGQSKTDWEPEVYAKTVEVYANAMRKLFEDAQKKYPELRDHKLYISTVGFPVMGNNMKFVDTPDRKINIRWTTELNNLYEKGIIDAVQEHFYPYSNANGGALVWSVHNLHNIFSVRKNIPNERLGGYVDPIIAYKMPMEITEWNVRCWGPQYTQNVKFKNPGFEDELNGWNITGGGQKSTVSWAARKGNKGLRVIQKAGDEPFEISQVFDKPENAIIMIAGVWVRTANPEAVKLNFKIADDDETKGTIIGGWTPKLTDTWEQVVFSAHNLDKVKQLEVMIRIDKPAVVYIDDLKIYSTDQPSGHATMAANIYEQVLFCVDALRIMAINGCPRTHLHHLFGDYPCGVMSMNGEIKPLGKAFLFYSDAYGERLVDMDYTSETFEYYTQGNPWATDFNALAPDRNDVPVLSYMASRDDDNLYIMLLNRSSDRTGVVDIDINADPIEKTAKVRTLYGDDIDMPGAYLEEEEINISRNFTQSIEPYSAQIITIKLK